MPKFTLTKPTPFVVPDGKYKIEIENAEDRTGKDSGNPYTWLKCRVKLADGSNGPVIYKSLFYTEKAKGRTASAFEALGIAVVYDQEDEFPAEDLIGKEAHVILKHNAETDYMEIASWVSPKSSPPAPKAKPAKETDDIPF
jgi:hypothetical protein